MLDEESLFVYKVYVKTNERGIITAVNSSAFISDPTGWTEIDEGTGDRYHHAQNHYFDKSLIDENGSYNYKLTGSTVEERASEEKAEDVKPETEPQPTVEEKLAAQEEQIAMLTDCIMEMSEIVYA